MQDSIVLQRFRKFRAMILSSNIDGNILLEMAEAFITSSDDDTAPNTEAVSVMEGQMSLFDYCTQS